MVEVLCPVCGRPLAREAARWHCGAGHSFDVARQNYVNLLLPNRSGAQDPGDSQEMVAFITELNANFYSIWFIRENGSDQYYRHNKGLLFDDRQKLILGQMEELENTMKRGITDVRVKI